MATLNSPSPAMIGEIALKLSELSAEEVSAIRQILEQLQQTEPDRRVWTAAEICEIAKKRAALLRHVPRGVVAARFSELAEEIRREAIASGKAIDGDWSGD